MQLKYNECSENLRQEKLNRAREVYIGKVKRLQKFYRRRHKRRTKCSTIICSLIRMFIKRRRYKRLLKMNKASNIIRLLIEIKNYKFGINRWNRETKAIKIQALYRGYLARKELSRLKKNRAWYHIKHLIIKSFSLKLK